MSCRTVAESQNPYYPGKLDGDREGDCDTVDSCLAVQAILWCGRLRIYPMCDVLSNIDINGDTEGT